MESFLALFIFQDSYVVSFLVLAIAIVIVLLLIFNHKSPENIIQSEITDSEPIEGALRRVLGEQRWMQNSSTAPLTGESQLSPQELEKLENEILEKDRVIADLNKQLTQGHGSMAISHGDDQDLANKIAELQSRLQEYEIIEDDIADLSLYRTENEKLKNELEKLKAQLGQPKDTNSYQPPAHNFKTSSPAAPGLDGSSSFTVHDHQATKESSFESIRISGTSGQGEVTSDLVAQFQKVVDQQEKIASTSKDVIKVSGDSSSGKVIMPDKHKKTVIEASPEEVHPKLKGVPPDSKEEAEVFITELKSLKKVQ